MLARAHTTITTYLQHWPNASWFGGINHEKHVQSRS